MSISTLSSLNKVIVKQRKEFIELMGYETRNKYDVLTTDGSPILHIAENQKGLLGFFLRQMVGHWRSFGLGIFDVQRNLIAQADHPFKFIFPELRVTLSPNNNYIGHSVQKFSFLRKKYSVHMEDGQELSIDSGLFSPWTFEITLKGKTVASIKKKWSGALKEMFTDADTFLVEFNDQNLNPNSKLFIVVLTALIDLNHFEAKAN